jgi:excisionase family DNA binding protein
MSAAHELPALVTVDDAAASLALHPDHVRRLVRTGELVGYRLGRAVRCAGVARGGVPRVVGQTRPRGASAGSTARRERSPRRGPREGVRPAYRFSDAPAGASATAARARPPRARAGATAARG